jgi:cytochrome b561
MSILILVWLRIAARVIAPSPEIVPAIPAWQLWFSKLMHLALYVFMIAMPLAGYIGRMLAGKVTYLFGIALPVFLDVNKDMAKNIFEWHEDIGNFGYYLIAFHAVAALFHHYIKRDNTLARMLPKRG